MPSRIPAIYAEDVMAAKKKWSERSRRSRALIVATGVVEVVLLVATLLDIKRRPADQIKGSKRMWTALAFINIVGPIAYFTLGRRGRASV
jgi:bacteriorhodopsin